MSAGLPEKVGAGLLLTCNGEALLLLRGPDSGNPRTWGLPGGNVDTADADLAAAALRECREEMGAVPPHTVEDSVVTRRGKHLQKHYTVLLCKVTPEVRAAFMPVLNKEHTAWQWQPLASLAGRQDLHPVVHLLATHHAPQLLRLASAPL